MARKKIIFIVILASVVFSLIITQLEQNMRTLHQVITEDPLLYSPEININLLKQETADLLDVQDSLGKEIISHIQSRTLTNTEEEKRILTKIAHTGFLPSSYLKKLPKTIKKTGDFLENPTVLNTFSMLYVVHIAARNYQKESGKLYSLLKEASAGNDFSNPISIGFLGSSSNIPVILEDIDLVRENGTELVRESRARIWCFLIGKCERLLEQKTAVIREKDFLRENIPTLVEFALLPDAIVNHSLRESERFGPYVVENSCFPEKYAPFYILRHEDRGFVVKRADTNYYIDFREIERVVPFNLYVNFFLSRGAKYQLQTGGNEYRCLDLQFWGDLSIINYFNQEFPDKNIASSDDLEKLRDELEELSAEEKNKYTIILDNRIVDLPYMFSAMTNHLSLYRKLISINKSVNPLSLLAIRSSYSLTYGTFSKSIWRLPERPTFFTEKNIPITPVMTTYQDLRKKYTDEEIKVFSIDLVSELNP